MPRADHHAVWVVAALALAGLGGCAFEQTRTERYCERENPRALFSRGMKESQP
jgi:hypothetical protein